MALLQLPTWAMLSLEDGFGFPNLSTQRNNILQEKVEIVGKNSK